MKLIASKRNQRFINLALAALLVVSSLTASVPFLFANKANAAPGVSYSTPTENQSDWSVDRSVPSGGWNVDSTSGTVTLNVDETNANPNGNFYQTEGVTKALAAGTNSIKANLLVDSSWSTKNNLRVGLWGVTADGNSADGLSYPIIEYVANVNDPTNPAGYTGWRVWNANDGTWHNVSAVTNVGGENTVEIVANFNTGNYDFYVNNTQVYSYSADGYLTFNNVILNNYNIASGNSADNYTAVWNAIQTGALTPDYSNVYVSNDGSDSNVGTNASQPFQTIQKAINTVATGGTVHIANGTYTEKLSFTKGNMTLVGESENGTVIQPLSNEYGQGLTSEGFSNITLSNITVNANAATSGGSAIKFHNAQNMTLTNVDVNGTGYMRGIDFNAIDGATLTNVDVNGFGKNGIAFTSKYATTDTYTTDSVKLTDVQSMNNGWAGIAFYTVGGGGATANISDVEFAGATTLTGNGQVGIFFEGGTDAGYGAHTTPTGYISGANNGNIDLGNTTFSGNGLNVVNYQTKNVYATAATINGAVGNSMTSSQINAAEATIIDHNDYDSYGDVILDTNAPIVAITSPADGAHIKGQVTVTGTVTDTDPSVSYLTVTNDTTHQQVAVQNVNIGLTDPSVSWNTASFDNGAYTIHLEAKDAAGNEDATLSVKDIHVTVDNTAPTITVKASPYTVGTNGIYSKLGLSLHDNDLIAGYSVDGGPINQLSPNAYSDVNDIFVGSYHGEHAGANSITVYDVAGNSTTLDFVLDNTAPTITVKGSPDTIGSSSAAIYSKLGLSLHDDNLIAGYTFNGGSFQALSPSAYSDVNDIFVGSYHGEHAGANTITVFDTAGNTTTYNFTLDNTAPTAALIFPARGPSATSFEVQFSEAVNMTQATNPANYFLTNWPGAGGSGSLTGHALVSYDTTTHLATVQFTDPNWYVSSEQLWGVANVSDIAGNVMVSTSSYSSDLKNPTTPTNIETTTPTNSDTSVWTWDASTDPSDVSNGASGVKGYEYQLVQQNAEVDQSAWIFTTDPTATTHVTTDGTYNLDVQALDNAGNVSSFATGTVLVDTTAPNVEITSPETDTTFGDNAKINITGTTGDSSSYVLTIAQGDSDPIVTKDGSSFESYDWDTTGIASGTYTATLTGTDEAGNSTSDQVSITVDNDGPATTVNAGSFPTVTPTFTGTVDTDATSVNVFILDSANNPVESGVATYTAGDANWSYTVQNPLTDGATYTILAIAKDAFGNPSSAANTGSAQATVAVPVVATAVTPATPVTTVTPLITSPADAAVLGASTTNGSTTGDTGVKGATDDKTAAAANINSDANQGKIFGLAWYWWILIIAALAAIAWFIAGAVRRRNEQNS